MNAAVDAEARAGALGRVAAALSPRTWTASLRGLLPARQEAAEAIPVREWIHSSVTSRRCARAALDTARAGTADPMLTIAARKTALLEVYGGGRHFNAPAFELVPGGTRPAERFPDRHATRH